MYERCLLVLSRNTKSRQNGSCVFVRRVVMEAGWANWGAGGDLWVGFAANDVLRKKKSNRYELLGSESCCLFVNEMIRCFVEQQRHKFVKHVVPDSADNNDMYAEMCGLSLLRGTICEECDLAACCDACVYYWVKWKCDRICANVI